MVQDYVCLDLETTGLNPKTEKIIEIGAVKVRNGKITDTFESFVAPNKKLEGKITEITGITEDMLREAPQREEIIPGFLEFVGTDILLGHSLMFDYSFLKRAVVNCGLAFEGEGIDTLKIARKFLSELESRRLGFLCSHYGIRHTAHRALSDARATSQLYEKLCGEFYTEEDFKPVPLIYKVKREGSITKAQKERLYRLLDKHKITLDIEVEKMTRSEASRYTDKLLAKYGR